MFLVRCPHCGNSMKTEPKAGAIEKKTKRCVYCGKGFRIHKRILSEE